MVGHFFFFVHCSLLPLKDYFFLLLKNHWFIMTEESENEFSDRQSEISFRNESTSADSYSDIS